MGPIDAIDKKNYIWAVFKKNSASGVQKHAPKAKNIHITSFVSIRFQRR